MKTVKVAGQKRDALGKKVAKKLREQELVPSVLYGGDQVVHLTVPFSEMRKIVYTPDVYLIDLDVDGETFRAIIQDIQWHPVEEKILHIDFMLVTDDKPVVINLPVIYKGLAKGVKAGGKLKKNMRLLKVKALAENLPDAITIDVTKLGIGDSIKVSQLQRPNLEFMDNKSNLIVGVVSTRVAQAGMALPEEEEDVEGEMASESEGAESVEATETND